jgi:hypothetical protein
MTQEDKELLLKDLCARLPYGVKVRFYDHLVEEYEIIPLTAKLLEYTVQIGEIPPYLFPLSSMTKEQIQELKDLISQETNILIEQLKNDDCGIDCGKYHFHSLLELEWCIKNHFDYRGLIPKGLAIDATDKNIY